MIRFVLFQHCTQCSEVQYIDASGARVLSGGQLALRWPKVNEAGNAAFAARKCCRICVMWARALHGHWMKAEVARLLRILWLSVLALIVDCGCAGRLNSSTWRDFVASASGVAFRAPRDYKPRNYGCWTRADDRWGMSGWRDLCVDTLDSGSSYSFTNNVSCIADCITYEDLRVDTLVLAGRRAVVERALASGGFRSVHREPRLLVRIQTPEETMLILDGGTGDEAGYDELLAIAATMRLLRDAPE
jgi:hypothetical protein